MRVGSGGSDVEVGDGGRDVEVGREVEEDVGLEVEELLEEVDELELSEVLEELSEVLLEDEDDVVELSEVDVLSGSDVLEDEVRVEVGSLVLVRVGVDEVIGAGASERWSVCGLYLTLPGGGSFSTDLPLRASVM